MTPWNLTQEEGARLHATDETVRWLSRLPAGLLQQFAGKWVAARACGFVAAADTYDALVETLKGTDLQSVVIHRIEGPAWVVYQ